MDIAADVETILGFGDLTSAAVFENEGRIVAEAAGRFVEPTDATMMYGVEIEAQRPKFEGSSVALDAVTSKTRCTVKGRTFTVEKIERTGTGFTVLTLKTTA